MAGDFADWGFDYLLGFLAFFNINLCVFNLIPLPPFDGGHLAILAIEGVMRRPSTGACAIGSRKAVSCSSSC